MLSINETRLMGWVGSVDPAEGMLKFTLATTRTWKDRESGDMRSETEWHRITVWRPPAPLVQRLAPGARVYLDGRIHYSKFEQAGVRRTGVEIVAPASRVEVLAEPYESPPDLPDQFWKSRPAQDADGAP